MAQKDNKYLQALKENENLLGVASAAALTVAMLNPVPLLVGAVAEAAYLLSVPDSKWYAARLEKRRQAAEIERRLQERNTILPQLTNTMQDRYTHLESMRAAIADQVKDEQDVFGEVLGRLDYLLEKFLLFAGKEAQFRTYLGGMWSDAFRGDVPSPIAPPPVVRRTGRYLGSVDDSQPATQGRGERSPSSPPDAAVASVEQKIADIQAFYQKSIETTQALADKETDDNTKAILTKRIDILHQRQDFASRIGKILTNLTYQLSLLEDTFGLINDQIRARSPEQVLADIDSVVTQTDSMTQLLEELGPYEQMTR